MKSTRTTSAVGLSNSASQSSGRPYWIGSTGNGETRITEELALFLERISGLFSFDDFLPQQLGKLIDLDLRPHQEEALATLTRHAG